MMESTASSTPAHGLAQPSSPRASADARDNTRQDNAVVPHGYGKAVRDHFLRPRNVGSFDATALDVGSALLGAVDEGAVIRMQIRVDESGIINDTCFKAYGCGATIAVASWVTEWAKGKSLGQVAGLRSAELVDALSLPPVKTHCAILAENAIKAAIDNYTQKQE